MLQRATVESPICSLSLHPTSGTNPPGSLPYPPPGYLHAGFLKARLHSTLPPSLPPSVRPSGFSHSAQSLRQVFLVRSGGFSPSFPPRAELTLIPGEAPTLLWLDTLGGSATVVLLYFRDLSLSLFFFFLRTTSYRDKSPFVVEISQSWWTLTNFSTVTPHVTSGPAKCFF